MNTSEFLNITTLIAPERTAIVFDGKRISYAGLSDRVNRLSNVLAEMGVSGGDRIAMMQVNCNEHIEAYFAAAKLDAVYVPLNFRSSSEEIRYMLSDASPKAIFAGKRYTETIDGITEDIEGLDIRIVIDGHAEKWLEYESIIETVNSDERFPHDDEDALTMRMLTAVTTGVPKGVMLSHDSFSSYILSNVSPADLDIEEKNILTVPLYHIAGVQAVMAAIYGGRTLIVQRQFEPEEWMNLVQTERANRAMMVPTML